MASHQRGHWHGGPPQRRPLIRIVGLVDTMARRKWPAPVSVASTRRRTDPAVSGARSDRSNRRLADLSADLRQGWAVLLGQAQKRPHDVSARSSTSPAPRAQSIRRQGFHRRRCRPRSWGGLGAANSRAESMSCSGTDQLGEQSQRLPCRSQTGNKRNRSDTDLSLPPPQTSDSHRTDAMARLNVVLF